MNVTATTLRTHGHRPLDTILATGEPYPVPHDGTPLPHRPLVGRRALGEPWPARPAHRYGSCAWTS